MSRRLFYTLYNLNNGNASSGDLTYDFVIILKDLQIQKILVQKEKKVVVALLTMLKMVVNKG